MQRPKKLALIGGGAITATLLIVLGFATSGTANTHVSDSIKTVAVAKVERTNLSRTMQLTAEMRPWQEIDIHAKAAGYLKTITVDIGDQVKADQVIATLDLPEQRQDQAKAEADYQVAKLDYDRIEAVIKKQPGLLAQEEVDKARAIYEEAKATYERSKVMADYAVITAPFDGVITKRSVDLGALVQAGTASDTQSLPLVHLAEMDKLRLDFPVPESNVALIKVGMPVDVKMQATGETVHSNVARMSDKVDEATRTMDVEVDLDNNDLHLKPGMYATATIALDTKDDALAAPVQAVTTGDKPNVWVVNAEGTVEERPVTLGIETPDKVELQTGVAEGDLLVYGNRNDVTLGSKVAPKVIVATGG
ncbi:MAG: efflux RND transporter periplasmic adaptor subunit [Negativicutes bacterium]|nr:efflux RND transporter periplasmic adaptor subunit [Negativicutes bacterium]